MAEAPVCTAYSMSCALGMETAEVLASLRAGGRPLSPAPLAPELGVPAGALPEPLATPVEPADYDSRQARLGLHLTAQLDRPIRRAVDRWGAARVGFVIGTSTGGLSDTEQALHAQAEVGRLPPGFVLDQTHTMAAALEVLVRRHGLTGPRYVVSTACSSGAKALASARRMLACGLADAVVAGGFDTLCELTLRGFAGLGILSHSACRPFSSERDGTVLGEGGALLLLERDGSGPARLCGAGETSDAYQMSAPQPQGLGAEAAMRNALRQAGVGPEAVVLVNAHGTGTRLNDSAEAAAIRRVLGERVPVISTKAHTGHLLGAAGALEAALCVAALEHGWAPASHACDPLDPELGIQVARAPQSLPSGYLLSNSFAFGGNNASLLWGPGA